MNELKIFSLFPALTVQNYGLLAIGLLDIICILIINFFYWK